MIYPVTVDTLLASASSWRDNTQLVVLETRLEPGLVTSVQEYLERGGKIWDLTDNSQLYHEENYFNSSGQTELEEQEVATVLRDKFNILVKSEKEEEIKYTVGFLFGDTETFLERKSGLVKQRTMSMDLRSPPSQTDPSESYLPVRSGGDCQQFDQELYFSTLNTLRLGRVLLYVPVLTSSMAVFDGASLWDGMAVIAGRQTAGVGRAGNRWLSPPGCSMFSLQTFLSADSYLGRRPSLLQHLVTLASVEAVRSQDGREDLDVRIKWPNDIYYGKQLKLGGVIAKSSFFGNQLSVTIGAGFNLDNSLPTNSLNNIIRTQGQKVLILMQEVLVAETFNRLEHLISECNGGNVSGVLELYYKYWLHQNQRVKITTEQRTEEREVTVIGIDEFGFLQVKDDEENMFSVTCDGNSFDMMEGLIRPKCN